MNAYTLLNARFIPIFRNEIIDILFMMKVIPNVNEAMQYIEYFLMSVSSDNRQGVTNNDTTID